MRRPGGFLSEQCAVISGDKGNKNDITSLKADGKVLTKTGYVYNHEVSSETESVALSIATQDAKGFITVNGKRVDSAREIIVPLSGIYTNIAIGVYSEDRRPRVNYSVVVEKKFDADPISDPVKSFGFENDANGAVAVQKKTGDVKGVEPVSFAVRRRR